MRLLLDTHVLIWWLEGNPRLSAGAQTAISDPANEMLLSSASVIEMAVKVRLGKLALTMPLDQFWKKAHQVLGASELPLHSQHAFALQNLPMHHRDPFDRLLVAQATVEGLHLVTADAEIAKYPIPIVW